MSSVPPGPRLPGLPPLRIVRGDPSRFEGRLGNRRVLLIVTGSVAAYKAATLTRLLKKDGADLRIVLTRSASRFVGEATFAGLSGKSVLTDMFDSASPGEVHVELAGWAEVIVVAPATADILARMAGARADDLAAATLLCARCPVLVAPAMHPTMWSHPATRRVVAALEADGRCQLIGPNHGEVASGDSGVGRMAEPEEIMTRLFRISAEQDLEGKHVVVTAGPTVEDLDPVRFLSNRSSGKMGFAVAERAAARGARVTLIAGPVTLGTPGGVNRVDVRSATAMRGALWQALGPDLALADALIMTAAVGDYRPEEAKATKIKRTADTLTLNLTQNPDILAEVGRARKSRRPVLVGFALETDTDEKVVEHARRKLAAKRCDVIVANHAEDAFGRDDNRATLVGRDSAEALPKSSKLELADRILDVVLERLTERKK